ncbi:MAG: glycosyltransferase family 2 protein [Clostridiales bacterium]|nr:glycosyltransferase family 2 protein [Clostridiales bacterium]
MEKILSVSVAAYNLESMIRQCLDSFIRPEILEKVEVLVTDDGSKDQTREIVAEYEKKYPGSFKLIVQKNAGPGSTVNSGLAHATGKYFRMVDGDDWVNTNEMEAYLTYLEEHDTDMVCTSYCCVDHETGEKRLEMLKTDMMDREIQFEQVAKDLFLAMHNVTYKTSILKENGIRLDNGFYTDLEYLLFPTPYIHTVAFLSQTIYMYRVSLSTQSMNIKSLQKNVQMHRNVLEHLLREYEAYHMSAHWNASIGSYYCKRIAATVGTQLSIYLSFKDTKTYKKITKAMVEELKREHDTVYREIMKLKTFQVLVYTGFSSYGLVSSMHRKKLGL